MPFSFSRSSLSGFFLSTLETLYRNHWKIRTVCYSLLSTYWLSLGSWQQIINFIKTSFEFTVIFWQGVWMSPNISHLTACSVVSWSLLAPLVPPVFNPPPNPAVNQRINWSLGGRGLKYSEPFVSQRCRPRVPFPPAPLFISSQLLPAAVQKSCRAE